jgi:hypothetical protein
VQRPSDPINITNSHEYSCQGQRHFKIDSEGDDSRTHHSSKRIMDEVIQQIFCFTFIDQICFNVTTFYNSRRENILPGVKLKGFDVLESLVYFTSTSIFGLTTFLPSSIAPLSGLDIDTHL